MLDYSLLLQREIAAMNKPESKYRDDLELVSACLENKEEAWDYLQGEYSQLIYAILRWPKWRLTQEDIEDICVDVFTKLYESGLSKFKFRTSLKNYIATITKRTCLDRVTSHAGRESSNLSFDHDTLMGRPMSQVIEGNINVAEIIMNKETIQEINNAILFLDDNCRKIIILRYREELAYDQISEALNLPMGTVSSFVARCTEKLIARLKPLLGITGRKGKSGR
jgi:RNA polymerase sigma factor (sigma-70 family)